MLPKRGRNGPTLTDQPQTLFQMTSEMTGPGIRFVIRADSREAVLAVRRMTEFFELIDARRNLIEVLREIGNRKL